MASIFDDLAALQSPEATRTLSRRLGTDERATGNALAAALPVLLSALSRNTASAEGSGSLLAALDRDHDGSILDDVVGALASQGGSSDSILERVLGARRRPVERQISRQAGLDEDSVGRVLAAVAPLLLGALGRARRGGKWSAGDLARQLGAERTRAEDAVPGSIGLFEELLDADGDGEIGDDVTRVGAQLLGRLFAGPRGSGTRNP